MSARPVKMSRRARKAWLAAGWIVLGTATLTGFALWLNNRRDTDLTDPTSGITADFKEVGSVAKPAIRFLDVAREAGISIRHGPGSRGRTLPEDTGSGIAWGDYDGDGDWDLYVVNFHARFGGTPDPAGGNRLYRNDDGNFVDVTKGTGVEDLEGFGMGATFADYDADGDADLYVTNLGPNRLFRNRGDGTFEETAEACGVSNPDGRSLGATLCDLDGDGWLDLYINNDVSTNRLYRNMGAEFEGESPILFADLSAITGTADPRGSMGLSVGEIGGMSGKRDGLPDLFITHWVAQENAFYQSVLTSGGDLEYRDKTRHFRLGENSLDMVGWGSALADFDLDGRLDIAVANGSTLEHSNDPLKLKAEPIFLLWNDGRVFHDVAPTAGKALARRHWARGLAVADYDRDGDVDIAIAINSGRPLLMRNETETGHHSLLVTLAGPPAARFGARVEVRVNDVPQTRWWGADVTFLGMHAGELVFGLGTSTAADELHVRWMDGSETTLAAVPAGRVQVDHSGMKSTTAQ